MLHKIFIRLEGILIVANRFLNDTLIIALGRPCTYFNMLLLSHNLEDILYLTL